MSYNPYKVLSVDPDADIEIITAAWKALSKKFHPDVNKSAESTALMQEINKAYENLKDAEKRKTIDLALKSQATHKENNVNATSNTPSEPFEANKSNVSNYSQSVTQQKQSAPTEYKKATPYTFNNTISENERNWRVLTSLFLTIVSSYIFTYFIDKLLAPDITPVTLANKFFEKNKTPPPDPGTIISVILIGFTGFLVTFTLSIYPFRNLVSNKHYAILHVYAFGIGLLIGISLALTIVHPVVKPT